MEKHLGYSPSLLKICGVYGMWIGIFLSLSLGQITRFDFRAPDTNAAALDVLLVLFIPIAVLVIGRNKFRWGRLPFVKPALVWLFLLHLSLLVNASRFGWHETGVAYLYIARVVGVFALFVVGFWGVDVFGNFQDFLRRGLLYSTIFVSITGLIQYLVYPDIRSLVAFGWDPHLFRLVGVFLDPAFAGLILLLGMVITWVYISESRGKFRHPPVVIFFLTFAAFLLTYSRSSYTAFIGSALVASLIKKNWRYLGGAVVVLALGILLLPKRDSVGTKLQRNETVWARVESYKRAALVYWDNPILGVGFNSYRYEQLQRGWLKNENFASHSGAGVDSSILFLLATTGSAGGIAFLWFVFSLAKYFKQTGNFMAQVSLAGVLIHSLFVNSLFLPSAMVWLAVLTVLGSKKEAGFRG